MWIPPEIKDPVLLHAPTRKNVGYFGAVRLRDGKFVWSREMKAFDGETFKEWRELCQEYFALVFLPPYSPELNTIERTWKLTRRLCTHNRYFATLNEVVIAVETQFQQWSSPNQQLRLLCSFT